MVGEVGRYLLSDSSVYIIAAISQNAELSSFVQAILFLLRFLLQM